MQDSIDVEEFANTVKSTFIIYFTNLVYTQLLVAVPWIAAPFISYIARWVIAAVVTSLATHGGLIAFIINTRVFTIDQAKDYMAAVDKLHEAPDDISDEEWSRLELEANHAFKNLIRFSA